MLYQCNTFHLKVYEIKQLEYCRGNTFCRMIHCSGVRWLGILRELGMPWKAIRIAARAAMGREQMARRSRYRLARSSPSSDSKQPHRQHPAAKLAAVV